MILKAVRHLYIRRTGTSTVFHSDVDHYRGELQTCVGKAVVAKKLLQLLLPLKGREFRKSYNGSFGLRVEQQALRSSNVINTDGWSLVFNPSQGF